MYKVNYLWQIANREKEVSVSVWDVVYRGGEFALLVSFLFSGQCYRFIHSFALLFVLVADWSELHLADRGPVRSSSRRFWYLLGTVSLLTMVVGVRRWTLGLALILIGELANYIVVSANGLAMPIPPGYEGNVRHIPTDRHTRLRWLSDIFESHGARGVYSFSIGDVIAIIGWWVLSVQLWLARLTPA